MRWIQDKQIWTLPENANAKHNESVEKPFFEKNAISPRYRLIELISTMSRRGDCYQFYLSLFLFECKDFSIDFVDFIIFQSA